MKDLVERIKEIGNVHPIPKHYNQKVITLYDAGRVLEEFRLKTAFERIKTAVGKIEDDLKALVHPPSFQPSFQRGASGLASVMNKVAQFVFRILFICDVVINLIHQVKTIVETLDLIHTLHDEMLKKALSQDNRQTFVSVKYRFKTRVPGTTQSDLEVDDKGTQDALNQAREDVTLLRERLAAAGLSGDLPERSWPNSDDDVDDS